MEADLLRPGRIEKISGDLTDLPVEVPGRDLCGIDLSGKRIEPSRRLDHGPGGRVDRQRARPGIEMDALVAVDVFFELGKPPAETGEDFKEAGQELRIRHERHLISYLRKDCQKEARGIGSKAREFPPAREIRLFPRLALLFEEPCPLASG